MSNHRNNANRPSTPDHGLRDRVFPPGTLRVLQVTDTHLYGEQRGTLAGVDTFESFRSVLHAFAQLSWPVDFVLATGDLVHDATPGGYRRLADMLDQLGCPVYCLPGNHDVPEVMRKHLRSDQVSSPSRIDSGHWRIVLLDTVKVGEVGGRLSVEQLDHLRDSLQHTDRHTLVTLHHQPVRVGSQWIDRIGLENAGDFLEIIDQSSRVRGLLWGHIHQHFEDQRHGVRLMATPSTCLQFTPSSSKFSVDKLSPGFRLLALTPDGAIHTEVIRTQTMPTGLDLVSAGYE